MPIRAFAALTLVATLMAPAAALVALPAPASAAEKITLWKTPWCGCCSAWGEAMSQAGYAVAMRDREDLAPVKAQLGVPDAMASCHTAIIGGYFLEGHVPLEAVRKLLDERPEIAGLAVPGMPQGSLGMGTDPTARYDVHAVARSGESRVFHRAGLD
ncbi:DUF411 domain-containing protein [Stappia sp.]|uniref:DUF411 domain-containing protein n=1 Tax=Stappia sp. TaxID=1870903 RepID=UPI0035B57045